MCKTAIGPSAICAVRLDRLEFSSTLDLKPPPLLGFVPAKKNDIFLRHRNDVPAYTRVRRLFNPSSGTSLSVRYKPNRKRLAPLKATIIANDQTGICANELKEIFETFGDSHRIMLADFAFDLAPEAGVGFSFVKRHGLFGKSRPEQNPQYANLLRYGTRKSGRFIRCYWKKEVGAFRVEVQITSRWIRESGNPAGTLSWLGYLDIFPKDFLFVRTDWVALEGFLKRSRRDAELLLHKAKNHSSSIHELLIHLRNEIGIRNPDRFLRPLTINREIARAWKHWSKEFRWKLNHGGGR